MKPIETLGIFIWHSRAKIFFLCYGFLEAKETHYLLLLKKLREVEEIDIFKHPTFLSFPISSHSQLPSSINRYFCILWQCHSCYSLPYDFPSLLKSWLYLHIVVMLGKKFEEELIHKCLARLQTFQDYTISYAEIVSHIHTETSVQDLFWGGLLSNSFLQIIPSYVINQKSKHCIVISYQLLQHSDLYSSKLQLISWCKLSCLIS